MRVGLRRQRDADLDEGLGLARAHHERPAVSSAARALLEDPVRGQQGARPVRLQGVLGKGEHDARLPERIESGERLPELQQADAVGRLAEPGRRRERERRRELRPSEDEAHLVRRERPGVLAERLGANPVRRQPCGQLRAQRAVEEHAAKDGCRRLGHEVLVYSGSPRRDSRARASDSSPYSADPPHHGSQSATRLPRLSAGHRPKQGSDSGAVESLRLETSVPPPPTAERDFPLGEPGFTYQDLHREDRLADLDRAFLAELERTDPGLAARLRAYRADPSSLDPLARSRLLVAAGRPLSLFLARLFGIEAQWRNQAASAGPEAVLFRVRRDFLVRRAARVKLPEDHAAIDVAAPERAARALERELHPELPWDADPELATARMVGSLLDLEADFIAALRQKKLPEVPPAARERVRELARRASAATASADPGPPRVDAAAGDDALLAFLEKTLEGYAYWCRLRLELPALRAGIRGWASFHLPETLDYHNLVATERNNPALPEERVGPAERRRRRDGFGLTDPRMTRPRDPGRVALLHALPRAREGLLLEGMLDEKDGGAEEPARHRR